MLNYKMENIQSTFKTKNYLEQLSYRQETPIQKAHMLKFLVPN